MSTVTLTLRRALVLDCRVDDRGHVVAIERIALADQAEADPGAGMLRHAAETVRDLLARAQPGAHDSVALAVQSWAYAALSVTHVLVRAETEQRRAAQLAADVPPGAEP